MEVTSLMKFRIMIDKIHSSNQLKQFYNELEAMNFLKI
jgi:hypothetical protein